MTPIEFYKMVEDEWKKLLKEDKEDTPLAKKYEKEMDYWWSQIEKEDRIRLITEARDELTKSFEEKFKALFPNEKLPSGNDKKDAEADAIIDKLINELEKPL